MTVVVDEHGEHRQTTIEMPAAQLAACRRLATATSGGPATPAALAAATPGLDVARAIELMRLLAGSGYLCLASASTAAADRAA